MSYCPPVPLQNCHHVSQVGVNHLPQHTSSPKAKISTRPTASTIVSPNLASFEPVEDLVVVDVVAQPTAQVQGLSNRPKPPTQSTVAKKGSKELILNSSVMDQEQVFRSIQRF